MIVNRFIRKLKNLINPERKFSNSVSEDFIQILQIAS